MSPTRRNRRRFRAVLGRFKRSGCNLLVIGTTDTTTRQTASRRFFGSPSADRDRLLVVTSGEDPSAWVSGPGAVLHAPGGSRNGDVRTDDRVEPGNLAEFQTRLAQALPGADCSPGSVRIGVTALVPFLEHEEGISTVDRLCKAVLERNGMGHYHLPGHEQDDVPPALDDRFDATVELRTTNAGPQERWHVPQESLTTEWISIEEDP